MNKGKMFLFCIAAWVCCCPLPASAQNTLKAPVDSEQPADQETPQRLLVERPGQASPAVSTTAEPLPWQATAYGEDCLVEHEKIGKCLPEFAAETAIPASDIDRASVAALHENLAQDITRAIENYYMRLETIDGGYAGRKFQIIAVRIVEGYVLIWLDEPEIRDGGRSLIYSIAKEKIVADFSDGGIRG